MNGIILAINISDKKKDPKHQIQKGYLIKDTGLEGDAHNRQGARSISLTSLEKIDDQQVCPRVNRTGPDKVRPGDFSETLTLSRIDISELKINDILQLGDEAEIRITGRGMECHKFCPWGRKEGDCPVPYNFLFAEVIKSGQISSGDSVTFAADHQHKMINR